MGPSGQLFVYITNQNKLFTFALHHRCRKSGWPLCGPKCEAAVSHNPEVVVPNQTGITIVMVVLSFVEVIIYFFSDAKFEIDDFSGAPCYLYECIGPLRTLLMQKTSQKKFKKVGC